MSQAGGFFVVVFYTLITCRAKNTPAPSITLSHHRQHQQQMGGEKEKNSNRRRRRPWKRFSWDGQRWTSAAAAALMTSQSQLERKKKHHLWLSANQCGRPVLASSPHSRFESATHLSAVLRFRHFRLLQKQTHRYLGLINKMYRFSIVLSACGQFNILLHSNQVTTMTFKKGILFPKKTNKQKTTPSSPWTYSIF